MYFYGLQITDIMGISWAVSIATLNGDRVCILKKPLQLSCFVLYCLTQYSDI